MNAKQNYLLEGIVQDIIPLIMQQKGLSLTLALQLFYNSETFAKLQNEKTGLYSESAGYIYELLQDEIAYGKFTQTEV